MSFLPITTIGSMIRSSPSVSALGCGGNGASPSMSGLLDELTANIGGELSSMNTLGRLASTLSSNAAAGPAGSSSLLGSSGLNGELAAMNAVGQLASRLGSLSSVPPASTGLGSPQGLASLAGLSSTSAILTPALTSRLGVTVPPYQPSEQQGFRSYSSLQGSQGQQGAQGQQDAMADTIDA